jgi:hypothetical protein
MTYDPSSSTGGEELLPQEFVFDRDTGTLKWIMPKAGYARLRIGLEGFPHLRTLMDWEPLEAGEQSLVWDGLDASGLIRLSEHPQLSIKLQAFALPWNTVIVRHPSHSSFDIRHSSLPSSLPSTDYRLPTTDSAYPPLARPDAAYLHARHPRTSCHEPRFSVEVLEPKEYTQDGIPVVGGTVPIRVSLDPRDKPWLINQRFEVMLYVDTVALFEEEEGSSPFTYAWDTAGLAPGQHLVTVNILSYDDHLGVMTLPVMIAPGP